MHVVRAFKEKYTNLILWGILNKGRVTVNWTIYMLELHRREIYYIIGIRRKIYVSFIVLNK